MAMTRMGWTARWAAAAGLAALIAISISPLACDRHPVPPPPASPGARMANLDVTLKDENGRDVKLSDFKGRPVMLNFWATWCGPCKAEMPDIAALSQEYKARGLIVLGISIDDPVEDIQKFAAANKIPYPLLAGLGHEAWLDAYGVESGIPISVFIRKDGTVSDLLQSAGTREYFDRQARALF